ncbi:MAG TPA: menaquinone biosynthesis protein [Ferruginibacter sp.]|nr:menaquinone biosynthesis protein [Ferruginibacter sp.]
MDRKIRVAAVSYLNTKPLTYGFEHGQLAEEIELFFEYPSKVAAMLLNGQADIGLIPVAVIPTLAEAHIISDYCIGTDGEVASVCLFSDVPVNEIKQVYLDYQSRTSVALLKILLKKHWNIQPELLEATPGFEEKIGGAIAGLVIGDRAFLQRNRSAYIYDLGTAWRELTGLPFVFAAWVANKKLPPAFIHAFNEATGEGMNHIEEIVAQNPYPAYSMDTYYRVNINYRLDEEKRKALKLFLEWL